MPHVTEAEMFNACRTLFGPELQLSKAFLSCLQPSGARSAYRKKAKVVHPDRFAVDCTTTKERQQRLFQDLNQAHQTVQSYLKQRKVSFGKAAHRARPNYKPSQRKRQEASRGQRGSAVLPQRPLQFGLYLYYRNIIPFEALISAITWQRRQRPALGEIATRWGWLQQEDIRKITALRGPIRRFGEKAEHLGLLNSLQVKTLLFHQQSRQKQIGDYFVDQGFFDHSRKDQLLSQLAEHNRTFRNGSNQHYYYYHFRR